MRRAVLCVGLMAVAACADTPTAPRMDGSELRSEQVRVPIISKPSVVRLSAVTLLSDCTPSDTHLCDARKIWVGATHYVGLAVGNTPLLRDAFSSLRSPGQLSFVVDGSDTIPSPPTPGPYRWALAKGDAQLTSLLTQAGLVFSDTIPGPPAPFMLANYDAGKGLMVLSVSELWRKKVIVPRTEWVSIEVYWKVDTPLGPVTYSLAGQLPPSDTIPADCVVAECDGSN